MIQTMIRNGDNTAAFDLSMDKYELARTLELIGIRMSTRNIRAGMGQDGISIQFSADSDLGRHLLALFPDDICLDDAQYAADLIANLHPAIRGELEQYLLHDQCAAIEDLPVGIHQMMIAASGYHEVYTFPLTSKLWDEEYGEELVAGKRRILANEDIIRERFEEYLGGDNMAGYYKDAGAEKLLLADWGFAERGGELYGTVDVYLTEPMSEEEETSLRDWIRGQNSDGLGEGFEQRPIELDEGELYVSFWHDGDDYYIKNAAEMNEYLGMTGPHMGGLG